MSSAILVLKDVIFGTFTNAKHTSMTAATSKNETPNTDSGTRSRRRPWLRFTSLAPGLGGEVGWVFLARVTPEGQLMLGHTHRNKPAPALDFWELLTLVTLLGVGLRIRPERNRVWGRSLLEVFAGVG